MGTQQSTINDSCVSCMQSKRDHNQNSYKTYVKNECEELLGQCLWAEFLLKKIKKLKKYPIQRFYQEMFLLNQQYNSKGVGVYDYAAQCQQNSSYRSNIRQSICEEEKEQGLKKMIKESGLIEEDIIENNSSQGGGKNMNDRLSQRTSFSKNSSTPSFAFQEKQFILKQIESEPQLKAKIELQVKYFLGVTTLLKQHLMNNQHQLHHILHSFIACFIQNYQNSNKESVIQALFDIQQFTRVYLESINIYYDVNRQRQVNSSICVLLNDENLLNFVVNMIFQENVYRIFYALIRDKHQEDVDRLAASMERLKDLDISEFRVKTKYQLNAQTHKLFNKESEYVPSQEGPYHSSIQTLKQISNKFSPTSKMKVIIKASQQLVKSIRRFYAQYGVKFDEVVDADEILNIETYILARSGLGEMGVHVYLIEKLATNKLLLGTPGYYLITLQAAVENINNLRT